MYHGVRGYGSWDPHDRRTPRSANILQTCREQTYGAERVAGGGGVPAKAKRWCAAVGESAAQAMRRDSAVKVGRSGAVGVDQARSAELTERNGRRFQARRGRACPHVCWSNWVRFETFFVARFDSSRYLILPPTDSFQATRGPGTRMSKDRGCIGFSPGKKKPAMDLSDTRGYAFFKVRAQLRQSVRLALATVIGMNLCWLALWAKARPLYFFSSPTLLESSRRAHAKPPSDPHMRHQHDACPSLRTRTA